MFTISALMKIIKRVVTEKIEFEHRQLFILGAKCPSLTTKGPTQRSKSLLLITEIQKDLDYTS